jgi:hypothetical protein
MLDLKKRGKDANPIAVIIQCWNFDTFTPVTGRREMHASWK